MRYLAASILIAICTMGAAPTWAEGTAGSGDFIEKLRQSRDITPVYSAGCCKTCRKGKACGNSCISKSKSCHTSGGCACNG